MLRQADGAPIAIKGLWDLEFGDGTPEGGKTNQHFFDAGPNKPGDSTGGLFGVIHAAGDQGDDGDDERETVTPSEPMLPQVPVSIQVGLEDGNNLQDRMGETLAAGVRRLPRANPPWTW